MRKYFMGRKTSGKDNIRWRSHEVSRIEALSDAVFAFAVSLLVISLEVPKNSGELLEKMKEFIPFIFCFIILFQIWFMQYKFFRRYGMHDSLTLVLNGVLLIVVLFYVYPLKFLFTAWMLHGLYKVNIDDIVPLAIIYHLGFAAFYLIFAFMYINAYWKKEELALTEVEEFETRTYIYLNIAFAATGVAGTAIAMLGIKYIGYSFMAYAIPGISSSLVFGIRNKTFKKRFGAVPMTEPNLGEE